MTAPGEGVNTTVCAIGTHPATFTVVVETITGLGPDGSSIDDSVHEANIGLIARIGVTTGCNPPTKDRFCPERELTRAEIATFLARAPGLGA